MERVVYPIRARVFFEVLVEGADGGDEDDGVDVVEVGDPGVALAASAADVVETPEDVLAGEIDVEGVLDDAHGLDACAEDIVWSDASVCVVANQIDMLIKHLPTVGT